jgi:hypothetical protein
MDQDWIAAKGSSLAGVLNQLYPGHYICLMDFDLLFVTLPRIFADCLDIWMCLDCDQVRHALMPVVHVLQTVPALCLPVFNKKSAADKGTFFISAPNKPYLIPRALRLSSCG